MERCPNCGEMVRIGARYCTTCGYRMPEQSGETPLAVTATDSDPQPQSPPTNSWPTYSPAATESTAPSLADSGERASGAPEADAQDSSAAPSSDTFWPAPPVAPSVSEEIGEESVSKDTLVALVSDSEPDSAPDPADSEARERVLALIDEVREFVVAIPNDDRDDLRGIVAELEVASTAPGAFDPDELANLRDALLAARDRPRDLDTVLDLTGRIDSMVALVFSYERSHAAIERALDVLRRQ